MAELHADEFLEPQSSTEEKWPHDDSWYLNFGTKKKQSQTCPHSFPIEYRSEETKLFFSKSLMYFIIKLPLYLYKISPTKHFHLQTEIVDL